MCLSTAVSQICDPPGTEIIALPARDSYSPIVPIDSAALLMMLMH
jgi:hypothetical protein